MNKVVVLEEEREGTKRNFLHNFCCHRRLKASGFNSDLKINLKKKKRRSSIREWYVRKQINDYGRRRTDFHLNVKPKKIIIYFTVALCKGILDFDPYNLFDTVDMFFLKKIELKMVSSITES